jgi:hypothetical protein
MGKADRAVLVAGWHDALAKALTKPVSAVVSAA